MTCPQGHPLKSGDQFCTVCGAPASLESPDSYPPPPTSFPAPASVPRSAVPAWVWVVGILIVAGAAAGGAWWLRRATASDPVVVLDPPQAVVMFPEASTVPSTAETPPTTAGSTVTTESTNTTAAVAVPAWGEPVPLAPGAAGSVARGIVGSGVGLVAVGSDPSSGLARAAVWTSPDGTEWQRIVEEAGFRASAGGAWMHDVALYRDGIVAVGAADDGLGRDVAVWESEDGATWARVPLPLAEADGDQTADAVTLTPDGPVAVGWADSSDGSGGLDVLWSFSMDGVEWQITLFPEAGDQAMLDVAWVDGTLVAVGFHQDVEDGTFDSAGGGHEGAVWLSTDPNRPWTRVRPAFLTDGQIERIDGVTAFGDLAVLVGGEVGPLGDVDVAVWLWDTDGDLRQVEQEAFAAPGAEYLDTVGVVDGRLVAAGRRLGTGGDYDLIAWTSTDGLTWEPMAIDSSPAADEKVVAVTGFGRVAVAVGAVDGAAAFWTAVP